MNFFSNKIILFKKKNNNKKQTFFKQNKFTSFPTKSVISERCDNFSILNKQI